MRQEAAQDGAPLDRKVPLVTAALRVAMEARDAAFYLKPVLTAHISEGNLEAALAMVKTAKEAQMAAGRDGCAPSAPGLLLNSLRSHTLYSFPSQDSALQGCCLGADTEVEGPSSGQGPIGEWRRQHVQAAPTAEEALQHLLITVGLDRLYRRAWP